MPSRSLAWAFDCLRTDFRDLQLLQRWVHEYAPGLMSGAFVESGVPLFVGVRKLRGHGRCVCVCVCVCLADNL